MGRQGGLSPGPTCGEMDPSALSLMQFKTFCSYVGGPGIAACTYTLHCASRTSGAGLQAKCLSALTISVCGEHAWSR